MTGRVCLGCDVGRLLRELDAARLYRALHHLEEHELERLLEVLERAERA